MDGAVNARSGDQSSKEEECTLYAALLPNERSQRQMKRLCVVLNVYVCNVRIYF